MPARPENRRSVRVRCSIIAGRPVQLIPRVPSPQSTSRPTLLPRADGRVASRRWRSPVGKHGRGTVSPMPARGDRSPATTEQYVDVKTAAARLNLPLKAIYGLVESGKLPALRFPVRVRSADLDGVLDRCRIKPGELRHLNQ